ncbi:MAG: hypothetical protein AB1414_03980 [bacterium]
MVIKYCSAEFEFRRKLFNQLPVTNYQLPVCVANFRIIKCKRSGGVRKGDMEIKEIRGYY